MKRRLKATRRLESHSSREIDEKLSSSVGPSPSKHGDGRVSLGMREVQSQKEIRRTKNFQSFRLFRAHCEWRHFMREQKWVTEIGKIWAHRERLGPKNMIFRARGASTAMSGTFPLRSRSFSLRSRRDGALCKEKYSQGFFALQAAFNRSLRHSSCQIWWNRGPKAREPSRISIFQLRIHSHTKATPENYDRIDTENFTNTEKEFRRTFRNFPRH